MNRQRLTIGTLQIWFDSEVPRFKDSRGDRTLASVEAELSECQEFIETWLAKVEQPPIPHKLTPEEEQFSAAIRKMAKDWRRLGFSKDQIIEILRLLKNFGSSLTVEQAEPLIEDLISTLRLAR